MDNVDTIITPEIPVEIGMEAVDIGSDSFEPDISIAESIFEPELDSEIISEKEFDGEIAHDIESDETDNVENELEKVREELDNEVEVEEVEEIDPNESLLEQIRLLDETIAFLTAELEELKKLRRNVFLAALKQAIIYFIKDSLAGEPQKIEQEPQREYVEHKISVLEKDILRLKDIRDGLMLKLQTN